MALRPAAKALAQPLADAPTSPVAAEFSSRKALPVAGDGPADAGCRRARRRRCHQGGELLFPADDLRDAVTIASGTPTCRWGSPDGWREAVTAPPGPARSAVSGGASLTTRYFHPFDLAARNLTLGEALDRHRRPRGDPEKRRGSRLAPGRARSRRLKAKGNVQFTGSMDLASVVNPLATPGLPVIGSAKLSAGASVSVGGTFQASGAFEIRASRVSPDASCGSHATGARAAPSRSTPPPRSASPRRSGQRCHQEVRLGRERRPEGRPHCARQRQPRPTSRSRRCRRRSRRASTGRCASRRSFSSPRCGAARRCSRSTST